MFEKNTKLGSINISNDVIATIVGGAAMECYGVVGMASQKVLKDGILCHLENPLKRGDGIVFDSGHPERKEEGGRVFDLRKKGKKIDGEIQTGWIEIIPGRTQINLKKIKPGQKIWKTNDPHLDRQMQQTFAKEGGYHKFPLHVHAKGKIAET